MNENITYRQGQLPLTVFSSPISTLGSIELHVSEACTRQCAFCPHSLDTYKRGKIGTDTIKFMSVETAKQIAEQIKSINFNGRVGLSGFGEPLMNPNLWNICWALYECTSSLEIVTNGDLLSKEMIKSLYHAGVSLITVNAYDKDVKESFEEMFEGWVNDAYRIRVHPEGEGLILNNRGGLLNKVETLERPCYLPFYKMMIDFDGTYLVCSNDWQRETQSMLSVYDTTITDFWFHPIMHSYRRHLLKGDRDMLVCKNCDCDGTLVGQEQFEYWRKHYEQTPAAKHPRPRYR